MATATMHPPAPSPLSVKGGARDIALDFTKGFLVLLMVLYHWFNYFVGPSEIYRYIRFLTPSFIFITGFIVANIYFVKYDVRDLHLPARLATRGLKLMAVFVALNVMIGGLLRSHVGTNVSPWQVFIARLTGTSPPGVKDAAFPILVPIGELLLVCAVLVFAYRRCRYAVHAFCLLAFSTVILLRIAGIENANAELIAIGSMGMVIGRVPIATLVRVINRPMVLAVAYVLLDLAIARWNEPYILQVVGVCINIPVIYLIGASHWASSWFGRIIVLLGKYSLFGYISQIAILQVLRRAMRSGTSEAQILAISFVSAFVLTILSVMLINAARSRSSLVDRSYKLVFA